MNFSAPQRSNAIAVSELNRQVKSLLESSFLSIRVVGEISNLARPSSGHWYFTLKDQNAQVRCAMFRGNNLRVGFSPKEGDQVVITAKVSLFEGRGDYQLICSAMEQDGAGQLQLLFEQLKAKLQAEGLFAPERKQPIPKHPKAIGVVTSPTGAAVHDILSVLKRRYPGLPVRIYPTAVQGAEAAEQICRAIELAHRDNQVDVLIVGRGGGSLEDLWPFNEESVARAIANARLPIVSAVGHEVDYSIADLVADLRAPTPSAAAELLSPNGEEILAQLNRAERSLLQRIQWQIDRQLQAVRHLSQRLRHPGERLREQAQRLDQLEMRATAAIKRQFRDERYETAQLIQRLLKANPSRRIQDSQDRVERLCQQITRIANEQIERKRLLLAKQVAQLDAISPLATLQRGYALVTTESGEVVRDSSQLTVDQNVKVQVKNGRFSATVIETEQSE